MTGFPLDAALYYAHRGWAVFPLPRTDPVRLLLPPARLFQPGEAPPHPEGLP